MFIYEDIIYYYYYFSFLSKNRKFIKIKIAKLKTTRHCHDPIPIATIRYLYQLYAICFDPFWFSLQTTFRVKFLLHYFYVIIFIKGTVTLDGI
jgi:hypothetical protein